MKSIAGYNVIKLLAKGGMAAIYLAEQASLQRQVVLKFLNPKLDEAIKKRFIDEGRIIASLKHPNIITVYDVVSIGKNNFLAMEFLPDGDLETRLLKRLDTYTVLEIISKVSDALHVIHKQGIIHGDIKPGNILFRGSCPLLTDFGISHRVEPKKEVDLSNDELYASPTYASPELIQGKPFDYRTDIYSLGIMMYEMLLGEKPYTGKTEIETIANSIQDPIPELPAPYKELQPLLDSLLAKSPDDRLSDTKLVTRFITQYLKDHPDLTRSSDTKLIDTEVVVEYIAKNKKNMQATQRKVLFLPIFFLLALLTSFWFYKDLLWQQFFEKNIIEDTSGLVLNDSDKLKAQEKSNLDAQLEALRVQAVEQQHLEQKTLLEQTNFELSRIKKELEIQKKLAHQKRLNKKHTISKLLSKGNNSLKKYQLTTPLNDNALYYFQKVLELDRKNKLAKKGINDVVYRYEILARAELEKYNYQKAQAHISRGLSIDTNNERLIELQKEANLQNEPKRVLNKVKSFFNNL
ncbi:serine/threonine-protein kinase [sulfur-oxidizing endosymbiont of Gigantopelta aegis]|uniref:serine/threonine-protein kinase n=1 Tax=sulfur-oxidizing endosymbiont of Gigantopelta aegis TaxID=2794934 RepID=UPI00248412A8|nr:serine/threonine-protein kinase [sulfur-oxidizing endosymbiont of Gigantopelta aegis]